MRMESVTNGTSKPATRRQADMLRMTRQASVSSLRRHEGKQA